MTRRDNIVSTYLSDDEKADLSRMAEESDESQSSLVRKAVLEYLDHDRNARLEGEVRELDEKMDRVLTLLENDEHTHTNPNSQKSVPQKAREITKRLYQNHETPVKGKDVEIAIEDIAGGDNRTVEKYKEQLKKRGLMYEHPMQPVWTDSKQEWVAWIEGATVGKDIHEYTDKYDIDVDEYYEIAETVTQ